MPRQTKDRDTTWLLDKDDKTWTLSANATIDTQDSAGIVNDASGSVVRVLGKVFAVDYGASLDHSAKILVGSQGMVFGGTYGIELNDSSGWRVVNYGLIHGGSAGIRGGAGAIENLGEIIGANFGIDAFGDRLELYNSGRIAGSDIGIVATAVQGMLSNGVNGEISGHDAAVALELGGVYTLVNKGLIIGGDASVTSTDGTKVLIRNSGTIVGDIILGNGDDLIDTRSGAVRGKIFGGEGNDTYMISSSNVGIVDMGASSGDSVRSSATYTLIGGLDNLQLLGGKDIDATGNEGANTVFGNSGNNDISGEAGHDALSGADGNDRLTGGAGGDTFYFNKGFDRDRIADFADGEDMISSDYVTTQARFDRLDIRQVGEDAVIDFGKGDRLVLENFSRDDLGSDDFGIL